MAPIVEKKSGPSKWEKTEWRAWSEKPGSRKSPVRARPLEEVVTSCGGNEGGRSVQRLNRGGFSFSGWSLLVVGTGSK